MFVFLSKFLPLLVYPLGLACVLLILALIRSSARSKQLLVLGAFLLLWLGGNRWVAYSLARSLEWRYLPPDEIPQAEAIVVLGGGTEAPSYPRLFVEVNGAGDRVLFAARLYKQGKAPHILLSGGYISWLSQRGSTPAEEMADLMRLIGIPEEALWLQPRSQNTYEDALYSSEMLRERGIRNIILVTSAQHMPRSVALFEHQGFKVIPAPTDYTVTESNWQDLWRPNLARQLINLLPTADHLGLTTSSLKEYLGILIYHLQGWL
ncbi:YdcF family protein [uncultured Thermanaerothrix sp.]|uniref:YdcF family protein n=1 Tax=uncultured Thermanaerothrix sp. TaxID=1195149 RepID=UPI002601DC89|nr:YdcF family protein [uncultured Thermanaerothrix sp.]